MVHKIASFIINFKSDSSYRDKNLIFLLEWLNKYFKNIFEIILVEQDKIQKFSVLDGMPVKYFFLYNPGRFNRGWGYNCAVKHFMTTRIAILADTDIILPLDFIDRVRECRDKWDAVSPYKSICFTSEAQRAKIIKSFNYHSIKNMSGTNNVTISGGILIIKKSTYMDIGGFEQYDCYGCEDRSMDVFLMDPLSKIKYYVHNETYIHLYHPKSKKTADKKYTYAAIEHLKKFYGCQYTKPSVGDEGCHYSCKHISGTLKYLAEHKRLFMGNPLLYKNKLNGYNNINTLPEMKKRVLVFGDERCKLSYTLPLRNNPFIKATIITYSNNKATLERFLEKKNMRNYDCIILDVDKVDNQQNIKKISLLKNLVYVTRSKHHATLNTSLLIKNYAKRCIDLVDLPVSFMKPHKYVFFNKKGTDYVYKKVMGAIYNLEVVDLDKAG